MQTSLQETTKRWERTGGSSGGEVPLPALWQNAYPPQVLALPGSAAGQAPRSVQTTYIASQDPQTLRDLGAAWSRDPRVCGSYVSLYAHALDGL